MAFLFDTDAISELLRRRPIQAYVDWLRRVPREEQYTSAVVVGELFRGAFRAPNREHHLEQIERQVLPSIAVLPYDAAIARVHGRICAELELKGEPLADADLQIGATAVYHGLELVTGNVRHFRRIPGLKIQPILSEARARAGRHSSS